MRRILNWFIPYDVIARWWYVLLAGSGVGLLFSLATELKPFRPVAKLVAPIGNIGSTIVWAAAPNLKDDLLFTVLGFLLGIALIWLLEEIRAFNQRES